jgi:hypothetical protein
MTDSKKIKELEEELKELKRAAKAVYQLVHYMEDNDGRIHRLKNIIFSEKK